MCGISGIFDPSNRFSPEELLSHAQAMAWRLKHRGPDDQGVWIDHNKRLAISHRRLSVIDTSNAGHQPMLSADGRFAITYNGEIYNYLELKMELENDGVVFSTNCDTEIVIECYRKFGIDALQRLDGMYAFCIFDQVTQELLLARDPFGEKPLYYSWQRNCFTFASELSALESLPFFETALDHEAIGQYFLFQYILPPRTVYNSTQCLAPGSWLLIKNNQSLTGRHFSFAPHSNYRPYSSIDTAIDELDELLTTSILRRLRADVPVGAFLSGGIDSSLIVAIASKKLHYDLSTFSIGFDNHPHSEHLVSRETALQLGTRHHEQILSKQLMREFLSHFGGIIDQPNADSSCFPTYMLSALARRSVTVALSGDGGDELFCGYNRNRATLLEEQQCGPLSNGSAWDPGNAYFSSRFLLFTSEQVQKLCLETPSQALELLHSMRDKMTKEKSLSLVSRLRKVDIETFLPGAVLAKVDRMSMHFALEVRCPFLTRELASFAEQIPPEFCFKDGKGKYILRKLVERYFPGGRLDRPKQGFGVPEQQWGDEVTREELRLLLSGDAGLLSQFVSTEYLKKYLDHSHSAQRLTMDQKWSIILLQNWLEQKYFRTGHAPNNKFPRENYLWC